MFVFGTKGPADQCLLIHEVSIICTAAISELNQRYCSKYNSETLKGNDHGGDLVVEGRTILQVELNICA